MDLFFKASATVMISILLLSVLGYQNQAFSTLLRMCVCVLILILCVSFLEPIVEFLRELESLGKMPDQFVKILLKVTLICVLTEITAILCADSGNGALGQVLKILSACVVLWLSIPVFRGFLELAQTLLEGI